MNDAYTLSHHTRPLSESGDNVRNLPSLSTLGQTHLSEYSKDVALREGQLAMAMAASRRIATLHQTVEHNALWLFFPLDESGPAARQEVHHFAIRFTITAISSSGRLSNLRGTEVSPLLLWASANHTAFTETRHHCDSHPYTICRVRHFNSSRDTTIDYVIRPGSPRGGCASAHQVLPLCW